MSVFDRAYQRALASDARPRLTDATAVLVHELLLDDGNSDDSPVVVPAAVA